MILEDFITKQLNLFEAIDPEKFIEHFKGEIKELDFPTLEDILKKRYVEFIYDKEKRFEDISRFDIKPDFEEEIKKKAMKINPEVSSMVMEKIIYSQLRLNTLLIAETFVDLKYKGILPNTIREDTISSLKLKLSDLEQKSYAYILQ